MPHKIPERALEKPLRPAFPRIGDRRLHRVEAVTRGAPSKRVRKILLSGSYGRLFGWRLLLMPFPPAAAAPIVTCLLCGWPWLQKKISYARKLHYNIERLKNEYDHLSRRKADTKEKIKEDEVFKVPTIECEGWILRVDEIENKVADVLEEYRNRPRCCLGFCPSYYSRVQLGRRVGKLMEDIERENKFTGAIVKDAPPRVADEIPVVRVGANSTPDRIIKELIECLGSEGINMISIWGPGGIGKTTILKSLNNHPHVAKMYKEVILATVSKDVNVRELRKRIAEKVYKDDWDKTMSDEEAITRLCRKLSTTRYLLLLDDLWEAVDLHSLGIPVLDGNKGKIVITTRFLDVCKRMMTNKDIKVPYLSDNEAWDLFVKRTNIVVGNNPDILQLAKNVVQECGGLPLAICAVGGSLRNEDNEFVWQNALRELRSPGSYEVTSDMDTHLFKLLKFSYDRLRDDNLRKCFLFAALYPEDFDIYTVELIEYWIAEGFIDNRAGSSTEMRAAGQTILQTLVEASLVENVNEYRVKLHDIIRDLALRITSSTGESNSIFLVRAGAQVGNLPTEQEWEQATKISFSRNRGLTALPERPSCSKLTTLLLEGSGLSNIPPLFFQKMVHLKVLDLSGTFVEYLPPSISNLKNLEALYFTDCRHLIAPFTCLEGLVKLRRLQIHSVYDYGHERRLIPQGLLSSLTALEELSIYRSVHANHSWSEDVDEIVEDIASLECLDSLCFHFPRTEQLQQFIGKSRSWREEKLRLFKFFIGFSNMFPHSDISDWRNPGKRCFEQYGRTMILLGGISFSDRIRLQAITEVLSRAEFCSLSEVFGLRSIAPDMGMEACWNQMEHLNVEASQLECLVNKSACIEFSKLGRLTLSDLPYLRSIMEAPLPPGSLSLLKNLRLSGCTSLIKLFPVGAFILPSLKTLGIEFCSQMEEIFDTTVPDESPFPALKSITLDTLPLLTRFGNDLSAIPFPSLENMSLLSCSMLESLHIGINKMPKIRKLICDREWWEALQWQNEEEKLHFQTLCDFRW